MSPQNLKLNVLFHKVTTNAEKLKMVASIINEALHQRLKILVLVPNLQAAEFLDKYLWQISDESFIPHCISNEPIDECAVITTLHENVNAASVLLNLNPSISPISQCFETIHDLEDLTSPEKALLSKERRLAYSYIS